MKSLTNEEINQISGGAQMLSVISTIEFEGIPDYCVESYFQANKDNIASFNVDTLGWNIVKQCPDFDNVTNLSFGEVLTVTSMSLVTI